MAENNRNWSLFFAQISFMTLSGLNSLVPLIACEIFAIIIHFLYLVFFTWTGDVTEIRNTIKKTIFSNRGLLFLPGSGCRLQHPDPEHSGLLRDRLWSPHRHRHRPGSAQCDYWGGDVSEEER